MRSVVASHYVFIRVFLILMEGEIIVVTCDFGMQTISSNQ